MSDEPVAEEVAETPEAEADAEATEVESETVSEDAETAQAAEEDTPQPPESSTGKKDNGVQKRFSELTQQIYQLRERAEAAEAQIQTPQLEPGKSLADFEYDEGKFAAYLGQLTKAEAAAEAEQAANREMAMRRRAALDAREHEFAAKVPDYMTVTRDLSVPLNDVIISGVESSEKAPEVLYYLAKHPEEAMAIAQMHPLDAARELGIIEASKLKPLKPPLSEAPPPPPTIEAETAKTEKKLTDPMSQSEFEKRRARVIAQR